MYILPIVFLGFVLSYYNVAVCTSGVGSQDLHGDAIPEEDPLGTGGS